MKKIYLFLFLSCLSFIGFAQHSPTCNTTGSSWTDGSGGSFESSDYNYGVNNFAIIGYDCSNLNETGLTSTPLVNTSTGYVARYGTVATINLQQGGTYATTLQWGNTSTANHQFAQVWIDFNDDGTFQTTEEVTSVVGYTASYSAAMTVTTSIVIPSGAPTGTHLMRMRGIWEENSTDIGSAPAHVDPCNYDYGGSHPDYWSGTCADYYVDILSPTSCTGTPAAGTATTSAPTVCPSATATLNLACGYTAGSGISYQWQSSPDSATWTNISGATSVPYTTTESATTYYRCYVVCSAGGASDTSSGVLVTYLSVCYCTPSFTDASYSCSLYGMNIQEFKATGESSTSLDDVASCDGSGYMDRTSLSVTFMQGVTYTPTLTSSGSYYMNATTWIDFDNDGTFASSEVVGGINNYNGSTTYSLVMPLTAATGSHRMRVEVNYASCCGGSYPTMDPCASGYYYGEIRDYSVSIIALPACSGTPGPGTATTSVGTACPSESITLSLVSYTVAGGLTFQWQSSPDSSTWTSISGATTLSFTTTESATTYFRCEVICGGASTFAYSVPVKVNYISVCYCTPSYYDPSYSCTYGYFSISNFAVTGESSTSINDVASCDGSGYLDRTSLSVTFMQGNTYSAYVQNGSDYLDVQTWIDFNDNGTFETSESIGGANDYYYSTTYSLAIPIMATIGSHRMRVVTTDDFSGATYPSMDPCVSYDYDYGEARDYTVNIIALPACTGTPYGGTASSSVVTACPSESITLNLASYTVAGSLVFQWQSSPDGTTWTDISGATSFPYSTTESAATYYRAKVTCTPSGGVAYSTSVYVNYVSICYCTPGYYDPSYSCTYGYSISDFSVAGESSTSISDASYCNGTGYLDQTALSVTFEQSYSYTAYISSSQTMDVQTWIDFNDDGTFASSESVGGANYYSYGGTYTITIPILATVGHHRMRVVTTSAYYGYSYPTLDPCASSYYYGETRDYTANIIALPACTGTPTPGTASASVGTACPSESFNLILTGFSVASGLTFQWQSSADSSTWTNITGATTVPYTVSSESANTYYRCIVTCTSTSSSANSNGVKVNYITVCYCTPSFSNAGISCSEYNFAIGSVYSVGEASTTLNDVAACDGTGYQDRTALTVTYMQGVTYSATVTSDVGTSSYAYTLNNEFWIDFNDDGTFASSEYVGGKNGYSGVPAIAVETLTMPVTATVGNHRMRLVQIYAGCCPGTPSPSMDPCTSGYTYGEARDYTVNIIALPACTGTPTAGVVSAPGIACPSSVVALSLTGTTVAGSIVFQWQISSDSVSWSSISGATTAAYSTTESATEYYRCIVTCTASSASDTSHFAEVLYHSYCPCTPEYYYYTVFGSSYAAYEYAMDNFALNGYSGSNINDAGPATPAADGYEDRTAVSINLEQGGAYSGTITYNTAEYGYENMIWIDFNDNGTFETSEEVTGVIGSGGFTSVTSNTFTLNVPVSATTGIHLMRVRNAKTYSSSLDPDMDPCNYYYSGSSTTYYYYGMTRDYSVNIVPLPPCTGTPYAGAASSSIGTACPSESITLTDAGFTTAGSLGFQWQSSADSSTWTNISGATTFSYSTTESATTFYRCVVTCIPTSSSASSSGVKVNYISVCYCTPSFTDASLSCSEYNFALSGFYSIGASSTVLNDTAGCTGTGYQDRTALSVTYMQGESYNATVTSNVGTFSYSLNNQVWIDFNDDGTFDNSETVGYSSGYSGNPAVTVESLSIPTTATTGSHRMRIVQVYAGYGYSYPSISSCPSGGYPWYYGEARDYTVNIIPLPACSGTPDAGVASSSPSSACPSSSFSLQLSGSTVATSLTYQWQSSPDGTTWTNISGATTVPYSASETSSTYFRCELTCTIGGASGYSTPVYVVYISTCYCTPYYSEAYLDCDFGYGMSSFQVSGVSGTSIDDASACAGSTGYIDNTALSVTFAQGGSYTANANYSYYFSNEMQNWIDFNDNGTFESSETVGGFTYGYGSSSYTISIPSGATLGAHRMRIVTINDDYSTTYATYSSLDPCTSGYDWGEARDYTVVIVAPGCTGTPTAGTISAGTATACSSFSTTLTATGYSTTTGDLYQWQSSTDSATWTDISGATGSTYSVTVASGTIYYRFMDTCTYSATEAYSAGISLSVLSAPSVSPIAGTTSICPGASASVTLTDATSGGTWSSTNNSVATVGSTGIVTGVAGGFDTIKYTVTNSCGTTTVMDTMRVNPAPNAGIITGGASVCQGGSVTLTESVGTGSWSSSSTSIASVTAGSVNGISGGSVTISYSVTNSCGTANAIHAMTVIPTPYAGGITGHSSVCVSATDTLSDTVTGGVWTAGNTHASVTGGFVYGLSAGIDTITYTYTNACGSTSTSTIITVNPLPNAGSISGAGSVCPSDTIHLTETTIGGTWSASNSFASVTGAALTGVVTGASNGTDTIIYTVTNVCGTATATHVVNVNALPNAGFITGLSSVCVASSITLGDAATGGTWSLSNGDASMDTTSVTGVMGGLDTVSYTVTNVCGTDIATHIVTVNPLPNAGVITSTTSTVCPAATITLSDTASGGTWGATNGHATVSSIGGVTGVSAGLDTITYSVTNVCGTAIDTDIITVITSPTAAAISGPVVVCEAANITLYESDTTGTWSVANGHASVSAGVVTGITYGLDTVYYTVTNACGSAVAIKAIDVYPLPRAGTISDTFSTICSGFTTIYVDTVSGGVWSSSDPSIATVGAFGVVHGVSGGTATITLTVTNSCGTAFTTLPVTINTTPVAGAVYGIDSVCVASTVTYADTAGTHGGVWTSADPGIASVDASTGVIYGSSPGTTTIYYTIATATCGTAVASRTITVHTLPYAGSITGSSSVCDGSSITLGDAGGATGGRWYSSIGSIGTVAATTGVVRGLSPGNTTIMYVVTTASCGSDTAFTPVTVYALPVAGTITGLTSVCEESSIILEDASGTSGGVWSSSDTVHATVDPSTGTVSGILAGTATITYTAVTAYCGSAYVVSTITIRPLPVPGTISGATVVCPGTSTTLVDGATGGVWHTANSHASVSGGVVTGVSLGLDTISYAVTNSCGTLSALWPISVNPLPVAGTITGPSYVCFGTTISLADVDTGGTWSASNSNAAVSGGVVTGLSVGNVIIYYNVISSCGTATASDSITVKPDLTPSITTTATASTSVCTGDYVTYTAYPVNGGASPVVTWFVGGAYVATGLSFGNIPSNGDIVTCSMVSDAPCTSTGTVFATPLTMTVNDPVAPAITITASPGDSVAFIGQVINFTAAYTGGGSAPTFQWYVNGVLQTGASGSSFTQAVTHSECVSCTMTSNAACAEPAVQGSNLLCIYADNEGIQNVNKGDYSLTLYPNPNNGTFILNGLVNSGSSYNVAYEVIDMTGKVVFNGNAMPKNGMINEQVNLNDNLAAGQYIMRVHMENGIEFLHFSIMK